MVGSGVVLSLGLVAAGQLVGIGDDLGAGERVAQQEEGSAEAADRRDGGGESVQVIDDRLRLNRAALRGGLVADHRQHDTTNTTGAGLSELAGEGVDAIDDAVLALPRHDLLSVDDIGDEGPHHEVEHTGTQRPEEQADEEDPGAVGVDDEHGAVHGRAEEQGHRRGFFPTEFPHQGLGERRNEDDS